MKTNFLAGFLILMIHCSVGTLQAQDNQAVKIPEKYLGSFTDDYGIEYTVSDSLFTLRPNDNYHIISWDAEHQFIIARNDAKNISKPGLYTRIDYMDFEGMEPFGWGFCLTSYDEKSAEGALKHKAADRVNPRKGCNGYPFSRMKRMD